jgi:hypothetical protein
MFQEVERGERVFSGLIGWSGAGLFNVEVNDAPSLDRVRAVTSATAPTEIPGPRRQAFVSMGVDVTSAATGIAADLRSQFTRPLYVLLGVVESILLVACVNLANLMLARATARSHEMSVRMALGWNRWLLARHVLTESLGLAFAGAILGLAFAYWGSRLLVTLMTQDYI